MNKTRSPRTIILLLIGIFLLTASVLLQATPVAAQVPENPAAPWERMPTIVSSWPLNETSGTTARDGWGNNYGTHTSGVRVGTPRLCLYSPPGYPEYFFSADYNGTNGRTTVNSISELNPTNTISLEAWIRPDTLPASSDTIIQKNSQYSLHLLSNGAIAFRLWIGGTVKEITTSTISAPGSSRF